MVIKEGYKQTDIGVIPGDWHVKSIEELTPQNKKNGIVDGPFGSNLKTIHYRKSGIPIITSGYVTNGYFYANEYLYVELEKFKQEKRSSVQGGDIVMAKIGERCGASAILPLNHQTGILSGNALKISIDENKYPTTLIWQILYNLYITGKLEILRTTGAQPALSMANLKKFQIALPPTLTEQTAIASALSDTDGLITGLEKLIAKKRNIKQGAMQQLLQPKEGWEVKKLGEIFTITAGGDLDVNNFSLITDEKYCYPIYSNALTNKGLYGFTSEYRQIENTITVTARGQVGVANPRDHKYTAIGRVIMLNPIIELNINFITECINNFIKFNNESTGVPQLTAPQISKYEIIIPDYKEQTQIAKILSDMDAEISSLEQKLEKYKKVKLGMMQELLTGKTRLN